MKINGRPDRMLPRTLAILAILCLCHCSGQKGQKETERYILESERKWAESVATGDTSAIERILAAILLVLIPKAISTTSNRWSPTREKRQNITFQIGSMT